MSLRVFKDWEANPLVDVHSFRISDAQAQQLIEKREYFLVTCADGRKAIQKFPPPEHKQIFSRFEDAWKQKLSGCIPVWQYQTA